MGEFFKGWRRKVGVVTLIVACALTAGWVRSHTVFDLIRVPMGSSFSLRFVSGNGVLGCSRHPVPLPFSWRDFPLQKDIWDLWGGWSGFEDIFEIEWIIRCCGFAFGTGTCIAKYQFTSVSIFAIPYWSIVIPLILLSGYLLLGKPKSKSPVCPTEPEVASQATPEAVP